MKNIKNDYQSYEESPKKIGMTKRFYKNNSRFEVTYPERSEKWRTICRYMSNFIESNIGKPFDTALSTFVNKCKERHFNENLWGKSISQEFIDMFSENYWNRYYVDCDGNIQKRNPKYKHTKKPIVIEEPKIVSYKYSKENTAEVFNILYDNFGKTKAHHLSNDIITVDEYNNIILDIYRSDRMSTAFSKLFRYNYTPSYSQKSFMQYIGEKIFIPIKTEGIILLPGTPEYEKYQAECQSSKRKFDREEKLKIEAERETLIHDIENNIIENKYINKKEQKFNEESFKDNYCKKEKIIVKNKK